MTVAFFATLTVCVILLVMLVVTAKNFEAYRNGVKAHVNEQVISEIAAWRNRDLETIRNDLRIVAEGEAKNKLNAWLVEHEANIRRDAISRSQATITGKVAEHLVPFLEGFPYNPKDVRFLGSPIDLIVFDGMDADELARVVFIEVKTGDSQLSQRQRRIRDTVRAHRVEWQELCLPG